MINRFLLPLGLFVLLAMVLAVGIRRAPEKGVIASPLIGKPAPEFTLPDLMNPNQTVSSKDFQGRWYLLNIWGTWCVGCRIEHDMLLEVHRSGAIPIVGLNWRDDDEQAREWLQQLGNPYAVVGADRNGRVAIDWGAYGAPETFLVDDKGIVVHKHVGPLTRQAWERDFMPKIPRPAGSS